MASKRINNKAGLLSGMFMRLRPKGRRVPARVPPAEDLFVFKFKNISKEGRMKSKLYMVALVVLVVLLVGSWGYFGWHFSKEQKENKAAVAKELQTDPPVKKSSSGICHDKNSKYYAATKNFEAFDNAQQCVDSGGRLPY
jgi:hypothetical protein